MKQWQDIFDIERVVIRNSEGEEETAFSLKSVYNKFFRQSFHDEEKFQVTNKLTKEVVGRYNDFRYARKQAKYRFKKMMKKIEDTLLIE